VDRPKLHDASLLRIVLTWNEEAEANLIFRLDGPRLVALKASGLKGLACPHENPWGPSVSVNEFRGPSVVREGVQKIEIEMQSGDTIVVAASGWEWTEISEGSGNQ